MAVGEAYSTQAPTDGAKSRSISIILENIYAQKKATVWHVRT